MESVPDVIPKDGFEVAQSVGIIHAENTVTGGDGLGISQNGDIQTPENGLVHDFIEENCDRLNKGEKTVNTSRAHTSAQKMNAIGVQHMRLYTFHQI